MSEKEIYEEERTIYMIKPEFLIQDLLRAFKKMGLVVELIEGKGSWLLKGSSRNEKAVVELVSTYKIIDELRTLGPIPVSKLLIRLEGSENFIKAFKHRLEVELLRCLG